MNRDCYAVASLRCRWCMLFILIAGGVLSSKHVVAQTGDSKRLTSELEELQTIKKSFESICSAETQKLEKAFDDLVAIADGSTQIPYLDRQSIVADLRQARKEFEKRGRFAKIPAMQGHYEAFVLAILTSYQRLMQKYQRVLTVLPKVDLRRDEFAKEIDDVTARVVKYDSLKKGTVFAGLREDFNWGPVKGFVEYEDAIRLKRIKNGRVEAEIRLKITERNGTLIAGRLHQGGFVADIAGTYDGVNLNIKTVRLIKGNPRYFEYSGKLVGQIGILDLVGVKANSVGTTGRVVLELQ